MNFKYKLMQFMSGRYGPDKLFFGLIGLAFALSFINIFVRLFANLISAFVIQLLVYILIAFAVFRFLSRNIYARRRENERFCNIINCFKRKREFYNQKKADKCHVYKKCPVCKAVLRLPHRLGKHKTVCPRCNNEFTVKVRK